MAIYSLVTRKDFMINKLNIADAKGEIREITVNSDRKVSLMNLDIAVIKAGRSDVSHISKNGQDIVLIFTDGTRIIFVDYFVKDNKIVIDNTNNNELYYITTDESGTLIFNELTEIEALLQSSPDYHWVAIPAVLAALAVPAIVFGKDGNGVADTTDTQVLARDKFTAGASAESDLTQTQTRVASAAAPLHSYEAELKKWSEELAGLTAYRISERHVLPGVTAFFHDSCKKLTSDEPVSVKKARVEMLIKEKELELARSNMLPTVSLRATYDKGAGHCRDRGTAVAGTTDQFH